MKYLVIWGSGYGEQRVLDDRETAEMYAEGVSIRPGDTKVVETNDPYNHPEYTR